MSNRIMVRSLRTISINSTSGHSAIVYADVPTEIPSHLAEEAFAKGCVPVGDYVPAAPAAPTTPIEPITASLEDDEDVPLPPVEAPAPVESAPEQPEQPAILRIVDAFDALVKLNDKNDFRTNGTPRTAAVKRLMGREVMAQEVDIAWALYSQGM